MGSKAMRLRVQRSKLLGPLCLVISAILLLSLPGCAAMKVVAVRFLPSQGVPDGTIERNQFLVENEDDLIGQPVFITLEKGDTLPDIARHFSLGTTELSAANPGVDIWAPEVGRRIMLPLSHILPDAPRKGIVINLPAMRLFQFKGDSRLLAVSTYPVGIGTLERPSPTGQMYVQRKTIRPTWYVPASIAEDHRKKGDPLPAKIPPGPVNPLGEYALYLSKPTYLVHGTNKPSSIGLHATNGCIRLYPEDVKKLYESTPVNTPVRILNQPYLVGKHKGVVYIEVHAPLKDSDTIELDRMYAKLINLENQSSEKLDWTRVEKALAEARGIPVAISGISQGYGEGMVETLEVRHPDTLYGKPEIPELKAEGWYVLAADVRERITAVRLAAIINHQGPPIPARVLARNSGYRVLCGPFDDINKAKDAVRRLRIDLEIEGVVIEPTQG